MGYSYEGILEYLQNKLKLPINSVDGGMRYDKLMIIAHIWYLRIHGKSLLNEEIVVSDISVNIQRYVNERRFMRISLFKVNFSDKERAFIDLIIDRCKKWDEDQLAVLARNMCQHEKCLKDNVRVVPESYMTEVKDNWF